MRAKNVIIWSDRSTWHDHTSRWLEAATVPGGVERLRSRGRKDLSSDDTEWLDILNEILTDDIVITIADLADDLRLTPVRVYHACRVINAGAFYTQGVKRNHPQTLADETRSIVDGEPALHSMREHLEQAIAEFCNRGRKGRVFASFDDRPFFSSSSHYMLYGSEWILSVLIAAADARTNPILVETIHETLRARGVPTVLEIDLPFRLLSEDDAWEFATAMLTEWTRFTCNQDDFVPEIDKSVTLTRKIPGKYVVGHYHPTTIRDPYYLNTVRTSTITTCPHCSPVSISSD